MTIYLSWKHVEVTELGFISRISSNFNGFHETCDVLGTIPESVFLCLNFYHYYYLMMSLFFIFICFYCVALSLINVSIKFCINLLFYLFIYLYYLSFLIEVLPILCILFFLLSIRLSLFSLDFNWQFFCSYIIQKKCSGLQNTLEEQIPKT